MSASILSNSRKFNSFAEPSSMYPKRSQEVQIEQAGPSSPTNDPSLADNNPLNHSDYFYCAYEPLIESLDSEGAQRLSVHDLIEAYSTFNNYIRDIASSLQELQGRPPALTKLRDDARYLLRAFRRDIQTTLINPFDGFKTNQTGSKAAVAQRVRDLALLCQICLATVSSIFAHPALYTVFCGKFAVIILLRRGLQYEQTTT
jgi:hypothetical protein